MSQPSAPPYSQYPPAYSILPVPDQSSYPNRDKWQQLHAMYHTSSDIGYTRPQQAIYPSNRAMNPGYLYGNQPLPGQATSYPPRNRSEPVSRRTTIAKEERRRTDNMDICLMAMVAALCCCFLCTDMAD